MRKYLSYVKAQKAPELDGECEEYLAQYYKTLRSKYEQYDQNRVTQPVTVRTLESVIRLATASAKLKLQKKVTVQDVDYAINLVNTSIFQEK